MLPSPEHRDSMGLPGPLSRLVSFALRSERFSPGGRGHCRAFASRHVRLGASFTLAGFNRRLTGTAEDKVDGSAQAECGPQVVQLGGFLQVQHGEWDEHR